MSRILSLTSTTGEQFSGNVVEQAARETAAMLRQSGAVIAVPTETVYGLVCRASDAAAIQRIYDLKHREPAKPLAWFIADWRKLSDFGVILEGLPAALAERYCPGPITIIAPTRQGEQDGLDEQGKQCGLGKQAKKSDTVGFRVPDHPFIRRLLELTGEPLASTSANRSGRPNALNLTDALHELSGAPDLAVDGGPIGPGALASTVVDATGPEPRILRQGALQISL